MREVGDKVLVGFMSGLLYQFCIDGVARREPYAVVSQGDDDASQRMGVLCMIYGETQVPNNICQTPRPPHSSALSFNLLITRSVIQEPTIAMATAPITAWVFHPDCTIAARRPYLLTVPSGGGDSVSHRRTKRMLSGNAYVCNLRYRRPGSSPKGSRIWRLTV